ncbi:hypothetical protein A1D22_10465 [Pasteurellaceae bacterium LFhippo2]|nr:hypothetical protein [Pasteurellaceae bacterium LFhippo2]
MSNYYSKPTNYIEDLSVNILKELGIECERNNQQEITAVDIKTTSGLKIDAQFSKNFAQYGDYRLDTISAFFPRNTPKNKSYQYDNSLSFTQNFQKKFNCTVSKTGKVFKAGYLDALIILFYNFKEMHNEPDNILIISKDKLIKYLEKNKVDCFNNIILNNKDGLDDSHGSAFIPINVEKLTNSVECFFGNRKSLNSQKAAIQAYLSK